MKLSVSLFASLLLLITSASNAAEISSDKKRQIDELLYITGAAKMGEMFSNAFIENMTRILKSSKPDIDPKAYDIVEEEIKSIIHHEVYTKNALNELIYPIYDKYLSSSDLTEIIKFYKTPVGQKTINVLPTITQEAMQAGQIWGQSLGPVIEQRIIARFDKEGIKYKN